MMDLVCRRYPGKKPSDYLEIEDDYTALQVDFAIAYKHQQDDYKYDADRIEAIISAIKPLGTAWGIKYTEKPKEDSLESKVMPQGLPVEQVIAMLTGKGTKVVRHG